MGFVVASINYRLSQHAIFPAQIEDCKAAIRFLRANAKTYNIDPARIGVGGLRPAGTWLPLLGTTGDDKQFDKGPNLEQSSAVQAVCDFFGPTDFAKISDVSQYHESRCPRFARSHSLIGGPIGEKTEACKRANPDLLYHPQRSALPDRPRR